MGIVGFEDEVDVVVVVFEGDVVFFFGKVEEVVSMGKEYVFIFGLVFF